MHQMTLSPAIGYAGIQLLAPLAADRPWKPPTSSPLAPPQHGSGRSGIQLLAPLAADRPWKPPTSSSLADEKRLHSLLLSTAAGDPVFNCSLRSLRIALGSSRLRRHSQTRSVSTRSSSARQRAIRARGLRQLRHDQVV